MKPITVLLADDHTIVREGFRELLKLASDIEVVGQAKTGREAVRLTRELLPAVVVMDIAMPRLNGIEASRQILKELPATRILILSAHGDDAFVAQVSELGVAGFLVKQTSAAILPKAIREVFRGNRFFSPSIARYLRERGQPTPHGATGQLKQKSVKLTSREIEVLQLVAEGRANKQSADELGISIKTVEKHRQSLMNKLQIHDTAGLTRYAIAAGIIEGGYRVTTE
jgi:DNA-binding NarL/FixJ family response regulator